MSEKPKTIEAYIAAATPVARPHLNSMLAILRDVAPEADEAIKWGAPTFSYHRILFTFAGFKAHLGFYPTPATLSHFEEELKDYKTGKGSVQFPYDKPLPEALIRKIATHRVRDLKENDARWM